MNTTIEMNPTRLHDLMIREETDGTNAPDFRRLLTDYRMRLGIALRCQDGPEIATRRRECVSFLEGWVETDLLREWGVSS
jgi:hypothetical protein